MRCLFDGGVRTEFLLLALLLAISGCSNKEASTPSDAMVQFIEAMHEGDPEIQESDWP